MSIVDHKRRERSSALVSTARLARWLRLTAAADVTGVTEIAVSISAQESDSASIARRLPDPLLGTHSMY